jgi:hypothetical protein
VWLPVMQGNSICRVACSRVIGLIGDKL